jgi:crotonobetainyl-CoA:carnitine CoA-transferase CaiB-like acyl-CoA transferase
MTEQIFSDVKVLDLTWYIAGPYCTKLLADYGADVLKIEIPGQGDPARRMPPFLNDDAHPEKSLLFSHLNLNKRGITLNLKSDRGRSIIKELVKDTDILVESFSPGVMDRLGLDYESLKDLNPRLIMTSISNFGQSGPYRDFKISELILNGFHSQINSGEPDRFPLKKGGNVCLYQGGLMASLAIAGALWAGEEEGIGQFIDVSLMEVMAGDPDRKTVDLLSWAYSGQRFYTMRSEGVEWQMDTIMPKGIFPCRDGFILSSPLLAHWTRFVALMKNPELERLQFPDDVLETESEMKGKIDILWYEWLSERTKREVMEACQAVKFFVTAVATPRDAVEDPHFKGHGFWVEVDHPVTGKQTYPGAPIRIGPGSWQVRLPAPMIGQHNQEIYQDRLGYSKKELFEFQKTGMI